MHHLEPSVGDNRRVFLLPYVRHNSGWHSIHALLHGLFHGYYSYSHSKKLLIPSIGLSPTGCAILIINRFFCPSAYPQRTKACIIHTRALYKGEREHERILYSKSLYRQMRHAKQPMTSSIGLLETACAILIIDCFFGLSSYSQGTRV